MREISPLLTNRQTAGASLTAARYELSCGVPGGATGATHWGIAGHARGERNHAAALGAADVASSVK